MIVDQLSQQQTNIGSSSLAFACFGGMAPKKKGKATARAASSPAADEDAMVIDSPKPQPEEPPKPDYDILKDPWTDEQETSLFKGIIQWKPAGNAHVKPD
jgi:hypothetical protein